MLGASAPKNPQAEIKKAPPKPEPQNVYPPEPEMIRPKGDLDRSSSDAPPRGPEAPVTIVPLSGNGTIPKRDEPIFISTPPAPISVPKNDLPRKESRRPPGRRP